MWHFITMANYFLVNLQPLLLMRASIIQLFVFQRAHFHGTNKKMPLFDLCNLSIQCGSRKISKKTAPCNCSIAFFFLSLSICCHTLWNETICYIGVFIRISNNETKWEHLIAFVFEFEFWAICFHSPEFRVRGVVFARCYTQWTHTQTHTIIRWLIGKLL